MPRYHRNARVEILIDRDKTNAVNRREPKAVVATFASPLIVYRIIDGEELAIAFKNGRFDGGLWSTDDEQAHGASWAASTDGLIEWGRAQQGWGRYGKDLFLVAADAEWETFYHEMMIVQGSIQFDPRGDKVQPAAVDADLCNTGLGCSMRILAGAVTVFRVTKSGLKEMDADDIEHYLAKHPIGDVSLRELGGGAGFLGGVILGHSVVVGSAMTANMDWRKNRDWFVELRGGRRIVEGAKTRNAAVKKAQEFLSWLGKGEL